MSFAGRDESAFPDPSSGRPLTPSLKMVAVVAAVLVVAYLAVQRGTLTIDLLYWLLALVPALVIHELAHGLVADRFGDHSARRANQLTINPAKHFDLFGVVILPLLIILSHGPPVGYARPMPVDSGKMTKNQAFLTAIAGSLANLAAAVVIALVVGTLSWASSVLVGALTLIGATNLIVGVLYLLPIPPLDGAAVFDRFLPYRHRARYEAFRRWSVLVIFGILLLLPAAPWIPLRPFLILYSALLS